MFGINVQIFHKTEFNATEAERGTRQVKSRDLRVLCVLASKSTSVAIHSLYTKFLY
jgi:hypothetical protein